MEDHDLVLRLQAKDDAAYKELIEKYQNKLIRFASRYVGEADAQDIVQNTFVKVYKSSQRIDVAKKLSTYLFEITKNEAISFLRKHRREVPLDEQIIASSPEFAEELGVTKVVEKLPDKYKKVIKFYYFDELSYQQIAAKLSLPVNTIRTHLHRAKMALKDMLTRVFGKIQK